MSEKRDDVLHGNTSPKLDGEREEGQVVTTLQAFENLCDIAADYVYRLGVKNGLYDEVINNQME